MRSSDLISIASPIAESGSVRHKSAGMAWLLSMLVPGLGHFYCGTMLRGALVFGFSLVGMSALLTSLVRAAQGLEADSFLAGVAMQAVPALYIFGFLDAYFTAREVSRGIDPSLVDNPRVACLLNLTTKGLGYFYLGERVKGIAVFVGTSVVNLLTPQIFGGGSRVLAITSLAVWAVAIVIAVDGYRAGARSFAAQVSGLDLAPEPPASRLPALLPLVIAGAIAAVFGGMMLFGAAALLLPKGSA
jgi:hypothetical protein